VNNNISWYSMSRELAVQEHESIGLAQALQIVDRYLARGNERFASGEAAIAATMFGFSRSRSEFIEICINGPTQISYKFEASDPDASWFRKLFMGVFRHEEELQSREQLVRKVEEFFTTPGPELRRKLQGR
jgi:hypothetical protein